LFALSLGALFAACSTSPTSAGCSVPLCAETARHAPIDPLMDLLRYVEAIRATTAEAQQREYRRVEARFLERREPRDRFALALLLSSPEAPFHNDAKAKELLFEYIDDNPDNTAYRPLAAFLLRGLNERRAMEQTVEVERRQTQALRKQMEELKAIEQHMNQRDQVKQQRGSP
jgi:hypothetical protein